MNVPLQDKTNVRDGDNATLQTPGRRENPWVWATLAAILVLYVFSALRVGPVSNFGTVMDDAVYFSSAQALAAGRGYILPSLPVRLKATKYPVLYPLLLAGVWKLDPHFPGNVNAAVALTLGFGCFALLFAFLLLRRWPGLGDWQALTVVALCAFTGYFLDLSASVMTDVPFMAVMLGAIWLFSRKDWGERAAFGAGLLAGLSVGFRSLGMATIAGIGLALLVKREYRRLAWFCLAAAPLALLWLWPAALAIVRPSAPRLKVGLDANGWTQTLCYYSSYACNWRMNVSGRGALQAIILTNMKGVLQQPGLYLLHPLATGNTLWDLVLVMLVSVAAYAGLIRYVREAGWQPLPMTFLFYLLVIVPWPYTPDRFLVPFLPLFFGGLWLEGRHLVGLVSAHLSPKHGLTERSVGGILALAILALALAVVVNYGWAIPSEVVSLAAANRKVLAEERGAFNWLREHAAPGSRLVAYQDGLAYLYTGLPSVPPIIYQTQSFYLKDPRYAESAAAHMADGARQTGASYWLSSAQDYRLDTDFDYRILQHRQSQLLAGAPLVFQSADKGVRVYDVRCLTGVKKEGCSSSPGTRQEGDVWGKPDANAPIASSPRGISPERARESGPEGPGTSH